MEKLVHQYDMESMKMAMLKHEETFKQQVYELHRLYQVQKMLMKNMQNQETWSLKNGSFKYQNDYVLNKLQKQESEHHANNKYDGDENGNSEIEDESEIELTLGPTGYNRRRNKHSLTATSNTDSIASFSTFSTTGSSRKNRITVENSRVLSVEEQMRQVDRSLDQPPWLHQVMI